MAIPTRSYLYVEGKDDVNTIGHLLSKHGFDCPMYNYQLDESRFSRTVPFIRGSDGKADLLSSIPTAVQASSGRSVGFVLDSDEKIEESWQAVCGKLSEFNVDIPKRIPENGYVFDVSSLNARVGIWLMPDNQRSGALEDFLIDLVNKNDRLYPVAKSATIEAKNKGAQFSSNSERKAVLHAWLAWQREPGLPYGSAIKAEYFQVDGLTASKFVNWYRILFEEN